LVREFLMGEIDCLNFYIDHANYGYEAQWLQHAFMIWMFEKYGYVVDTNVTSKDLGVEKMDWVIRSLGDLTVQVKAWVGGVEYYISDLKYDDVSKKKPGVYLWILPEKTLSGLAKALDEQGYIYTYVTINKTRIPMTIMLTKKELT